MVSMADGFEKDRPSRMSLGTGVFRRPPRGPWVKVLIRLERGRRAIIKLMAEPLARVRGREHAFLIMAAVLLGVLGAYGAIGFRQLIRWTHQLTFGNHEYDLATLEHMSWWLRLALPTAGGLVVGIIVHNLAPEVKGSGIPEVMEAVARKGGAIRFRVVFTKALAAAVTIGSGGSAGREGPIVHIGSAIGSAVGRFLQVSAKRMRTFVACGAAAGIAATFNAPIAGALFAIEVVLGDMRVASMSPIVISSVVATVVSRHYLGDFPAFNVPGFELASPRELALHGVLGLVSGVLAVLFIRMLFFTADRFDRSRIPAWLRPAFGGLGVGLIALGLPHVFGVGYETINAALLGKTGVAVLGLALGGKMVATSLTLGSGGSGGVFAPSLFLGATMGAAFGQLANRIFPDWTADSGAYALVGMGAFVSATTHAPITAILIIFELTNDYKVIPPLMLACVIGVLLSSYLNRESIYTEKLARRGVKLSEGRDVNLLKSILVGSVMEAGVQTVTTDTPLSRLLPGLLTGSHHPLVVVDGKRRYAGSIELGDVTEVLPQAEELGGIVVAADLADPKAPFVVPSDSLDLVMHLFGRTHHEELPVCDSQERRSVLGVVTKTAVIDAYNKRVFQADLTGGFGSLVDAVHDGRSLEVLGGVHLGEIVVPAGWVGKNLRQIDPRRRLRIEVVLIHRPAGAGGTGDLDGRPGMFPSPDYVFEAGDRVLVLGDPRDIGKLGE